MKKEHHYKLADPVKAYPCFGIFADYNSEAPDSGSLIFVANKALAERVCKILNDTPDDNIDSNSGHEWCKRYSYEKELVRRKSSICTTIREAIGWMKQHLEPEELDELLSRYR